MFRTRVFAVVLLMGLLPNFAAQAHDIKVLASRWYLPEGEAKTTIYLSWGHRLPVDDLIDASSLIRYDLVGPKGGTTPLAKADVSLQTNVMVLKEPGVHQAIVDRKSSIYTYVFDSEGTRQLKRGPKSAITEGKIDTASRYQQCAKALIVLGKPSDEAPKAIGQTFEIVPLDGPSKWTKNSAIRFRVLLEGKPVSAAEVTARYVGFRPDDAWGYATTSNRSGEFEIRPNHPGTWVTRVHVQRLTQGKLREEYDFDSFTATLSFEVRP